MTIKKFLIFLVAVWGLTIFSTHQTWAQPKAGGTPPIITNSFAVEKGRYGYVWKIYIEAEDPDGDMYKIASVVDQVGLGRYSTDWIMVKPRYRKHFIGYIQWNTFSSATSSLEEWTQITLKVSIIDKAGNESNVVVFPFSFESGVKDEYKYKLPPPFDQGDLPRLGYIAINLHSINMGGLESPAP